VPAVAECERELERERVTFELEQASFSRGIWIGVIKRAAADIILYRDARRGRKATIYRSAWRWMYGELSTPRCVEDQLFKFTNLCHLLDVSPQRIRDWVDRLDRDDVRKWGM